MHEILRDRRVVPANEAPAGEVLAFLEYFDGIAAWDHLRAATAQRIVQAGLSVETELAVAALTRPHGGPVAAWAPSVKAQLEATLRTSAVPAPWPSGRVLVERQKIAAGEQHDRFQSLRVEGSVDPSLHGYRFFLDQIQQSLAVVNPYGHVELTVPLAGSGDPTVGFDTRGRCHAKLAGHLLVVSFGEKIAAIDLVGPSGVARGNILWEAATIEPFEGLTAQVTYPQMVRQSRGYRTYGAARKGHAHDDAGRPLGWLGPAGPSGVVFQAQGELRSVHPLTGEINWLRRDVPPGCVLFGDDEFVFALPHQDTEAFVFRAADGQRLGTRAVAPLDEQYATYGRRILRWSTATPDGGQPMKLLELADAWTGEKVWTKQFHVDARICSVEG
jgi:hypothetical protein